MTAGSARAPGSGVGVTVVIAARDAAVTLGPALSSVARQTRLPDEVVVVDDASQDSTAEVAARWSTQLPLRILRCTENVGPAAARHLAIESSPGRTAIAVLDADDVWLPHHLEVLCALHSQAAGIATPLVWRWLPGYAMARPITAVPRQDRQMESILERNFVFGGCLFSVDLYNAVGGFRTEATGAEDWDLWIRMIRAGARVVCPDEPTVVYRLSPTSFSADDRSLAGEVAVLKLALAEARTPREREVASKSLRRHLARQSLSEAYRLAREGRRWRCRVRAINAFAGPAAVAARGAAVVLAPTWAVSRRDELKFEPARWLAR